jgi:hypothetical protein
MSIILLLVVRVFTQALDVSQESRTVSSVERDARTIDGRLRYDLARATDVTLPALPGVIGNGLQLTIAGTTATYTVSNGVLYLDGNRVNSPDSQVSSMTFERLGTATTSASIQVKYTLHSIESRIGVGTESASFQTSYPLGTP